MPERVLHVPLLISGPGVTPGTVATPVQTVQLRATLRALLGLGSLPEIAPALPLWGDAPALLITEHPQPRWYYDELLTFNSDADLAAREGNWAAVERDGTTVVFDDQGRGATYDPKADPEELHPQPLDAGNELTQAYAALHGDARLTRTGVLSDDMRKALQILGCMR
jgi:hypothetical protein